MARQGGLAEEVRARLTPASSERYGDMATSGNDVPSEDGPTLQRIGRLVTLQALPGGRDSASSNSGPGGHPILDKLEFGKPIRQHIKEFAVVFAVLFLIIGGYQAYKYSRYDLTVGWSVAAGALCLLGYFLPRALYPFWKAWMAFAHVLGTVMTTLILALAWAGMLIPMALLLKVFRKKVMEVGFRSPSVTSYWEIKKPETSDFKLLERQF